MSTDDETEPRLTIFNVLTDMVSNLLYYDRKEDEDLPVGAIEGAIEQGVITVDEMVDFFRAELERAGEVPDDPS